MNIVDVFLSASRSFPSKPAIIDKGRQISFENLALEVAATAGYFHKKGIQKGDRVLIMVPMSIELYKNLLALFYLGATAVFLDEWVNTKRLNICCELAQCKGILGNWKMNVLGILSKEIRKIPIRLSINNTEKSTVSRGDTLPEDTALITFTTGSTGIPKAAKRTHSFLMEQYNALLKEIEPTSDETDMTVLPIILLLNLGVGCTSVIADFSMRHPERLQPEKIAKQMGTYQVNRLIASPFFIKKLAKFCIQTNQTIPSLNKIFTGGAPVFPQEAAIYQQAFPDKEIHLVYGSTEAEPISAITPAELLAGSKESFNGLAVGDVFPLIELKIIQIKDNNIELTESTTIDQIEMPKGQVGEIIVSGPHVLKEYYNNPDAWKRNKIKDGEVIWHRTGDSGYLENGNRLFLTGRCNQLILTDDGYLSQFVAEHHIQQIIGVTSGTVLLKQNQIYLVLESEIQPEIIDFPIKYEQLVILRKIPRDPRHHSKIDYGKLETMI